MDVKVYNYLVTALRRNRAVIFMFNRLLKRRLYNQVDEYLVWRARTSKITSDVYSRYLLDFAKFTDAICVSEITDERIESFVKTLITEYDRITFEKAMRGLIRYDNLNKKCYAMRMSNLKVKHARRVKELRKKDLSFREIARVLDVDVRQVYRWWSYDVDGKKEVIPR